MQSPININSPEEIHLQKDLTIKFTKLEDDIRALVENTGQTLKSSHEWMEMELGIEEQIMQLRSTQLHFKAPSEHTFNGNHYSLEMQIVSKNLNQKGTYVVLSLMMEANRKVGKNELADPFSGIAFNLKSKAMTGEVEINFADALKRELGKLSEAEFFTYLGSITTPPCIENVRWIIVSQPLQISFEEMNNFNDLWKGNSEFAGGNGNNRHIQEIYGREIQRGKILDIEEQYIKELIGSEEEENEEMQTNQQSYEGEQTKYHYQSTYESGYQDDYNMDQKIPMGVNMVKKAKNMRKSSKIKKIEMSKKIQEKIVNQIPEKIKVKVPQKLKQNNEQIIKQNNLKQKLNKLKEQAKIEETQQQQLKQSISINQEIDDIQAVDSTQIDKQILSLTKKIDTLENESNSLDQTEIDQMKKVKTQDKKSVAKKQIIETNDGPQETFNQLQQIKSELENEKQFLQKEEESQTKEASSEDNNKQWSLWNMVVSPFTGKTD